MYIGLYFKNKLRKLCNVLAFIMSTYQDYKEFLNRNLGSKRVFAASIAQTVFFFKSQNHKNKVKD